MKNYSFELGRGKSSQRQMKVQEILRAALVEVLQRGLTKEPLLDNEMITINYVDVSPDLRHVKFFFLPFNEKKREDFLEAFKRANKVIRREIGQRVHLKYVPTLSLIHISEPTRRTPISYAVFCL